MNIKRTTFVITQRCTLKCKLCLAFIPYYENPVDTTYDEAASIIDNYFRIVESVGTFSITGGEPLLNKDIAKIIEKVYEYDEKIETHIDIVTNGTLGMRKELLDILATNKKIRVIISNYGKKLSSQLPSIIQDLEQNKICYRVENYSQDEETWQYEGWVDFSDHSLKHNTKESLLAQAKRCIFRNGHYYVINSGELHPCSRSFWRMHMGIIQKDDSEYVDLLCLNNETIEEQRAKLERIEGLISLKACAYCNGVHKNTKRYKPAEQL